MKAALKNCDLRLCADDTCIIYCHQNVKFIERNLTYFQPILHFQTPWKHQKTLVENGLKSYFNNVNDS